MTHDEATNCVRLIAKLFSSQPPTAEQGILLRDGFKAFSFKPAQEAIKEHRRTHEFLSIPGLLEGCRAAERGGQLQSKTFIPDQDFASIYRRQRPDLSRAGDYEVIIRIHRAWWRACTKIQVADSVTGPAAIAQANGKSYAAQIRSSCFHALVSAGMEIPHATRWAEYPFVEVRDCGLWLEEVRPLQSAREANASAENAPVFSA